MKSAPTFFSAVSTSPTRATSDRGTTTTPPPQASRLSPVPLRPPSQCGRHLIWPSTDIPLRQGCTTMEHLPSEIPTTFFPSDGFLPPLCCSLTPPRHTSSTRAAGFDQPPPAAPCEQGSSPVLFWATSPSWPAHLDGLGWKPAHRAQLPVLFTV
jgi:hypothetical protein